MGQTLAAEGDDFCFRRCFALAQDDQRLGRLAPLFVRDADDRALHHGRVTVQRILDIGRTDVLASRDDHVLLAIDDMDVAEGVADSKIAGVEIAVLDRLRRLLRLFPVTLEHNVGTRAHLTHGDTVLRHWPALLVAQHDIHAHRRHTRPRPARVVCPVRFMVGLGHGQQRCCLRQTVDLDELPTQFFFEPLDERRRWRRSGNHKTRLRCNGVPVLVGIVQDGAQHRRRHAGECHLFALDEAVDFSAVDGAQDHMRAAHAGERVDAAPTVAMEHRQRP